MELKWRSVILLLYCSYAAVTTVQGQEPDPCHHYTVLNDNWRANIYQGYKNNSDRDVQQGWYRMFYEGRSVRMADRCVHRHTCGTVLALWMNGPHPKVEDDIVTREVCGRYENDCCRKSPSIRVKMCPGDYAVYELRPTNGNHAYCTDVLPPPLPPEVDPCDHYTVLNDTWRATTNVIGDNEDIYGYWHGWYRLFYLGQSVRMPDSCVPEHHCGTQCPIWLGGPHPKPEDGIVTRQVCGTRGRTCCHFRSTSIRVKMCPGNYVVYELLSAESLGMAYCTDVSTVTTTAPTTPTPAPTTTAQWETTYYPETTVPHPSCGGYLNVSGSFSSPYYPSHYHDNAYCVWRLSAPSGQRVLLLFTDLQLEGCCDCDYISVYDGPSTSYSQLGHLCSNSTADAFHSSSNHMTVLFRTDTSLVSRGFRAEFISSLLASKGNVECSQSHMSITFSRSFLSSEGFNGDDLYVNDPNCRPTQNSSQVIFRFPLKQCGTTRKIQNGWVVYTNNVRTFPNDTQDITYLPQFHLSVGCHMEKDAVSQVMYVARDRLKFNVTGTGRFNTTMAFYTSSNFYEQVHADPYYVSLGDYMYVQVRLGEPDSSLVVFLDTCVASPTPDDDHHQHSHYLLLNGCPADSTYYSYTSGSSYYARFRFRAFMFLRTYPSVYLRCKVVICASSDYGSRCGQGCRSRRVARQLNSQLDTATMVLGPIKLRDPEKPVAKQLEDLVAKADA